MSDNKSNKSAPVHLQKGYTPAPKSPIYAQDGYKPSAGQLGSPPTTGSVVSKPVEGKKN